MRASIFHLRNPRILVRRALPFLIRRALLALAIQPRQIFAGRRRDAGGLRQPAQQLLVTRARVAPHNRAHRRIRLQRRCINRDPLPLQKPAIGQHPQHPTEYFTMRIEVDQSSRARDRRVVRRVLVQRNAHKAPQRQRVRQPPGNPPLRPDTLEIPNQQRPKVNPRRQRRTPVLLRIKLRAPLLDKLVEALGLQQLIQTLIKRMSRRPRQLGVRDPDVLLLLPLLARPHRHAPILRTKSVDTSEVFVYESGLAPRAAKSRRAVSADSRRPLWVHLLPAARIRLRQKERLAHYMMAVGGPRYSWYFRSGARLAGGNDLHPDPGSISRIHGSCAAGLPVFRNRLLLGEQAGKEMAQLDLGNAFRCHHASSDPRPDDATTPWWIISRAQPS